MLDHSPAAHVRRPRLDYESHAVDLDRNEVGALLVALISLLTLNGLRVSEAVGADIEALSLQRGHRTLAIIRKGGKKAVVPLALRTARPASDQPSASFGRGQISDARLMALCEVGPGRK